MNTFKFLLTAFLSAMKVFAFFVVVLAVAEVTNGGLNEFKNWKQMDFKFPSPTIRQQAIRDGNFVAANVIPIDVAVDYRGTLN